MTKEKKFEHSVPDEDIVVGSSPDRYSQSKDVFLTFRKNRSIDLTIGRQVIRFEGREKKKVPKSIVEHKDFTDKMAKKFIVQEVE